MKLKVAPATLGGMPNRFGFAPDDKQAANRQRIVFEPWRKLYATARWRKLRMDVFMRDRFKCCMCLRVDGNTSRLVCDHVIPHKGDEALFWDEDNLQTLCKPCHDSDKQKMERRA